MLVRTLASIGLLLLSVAGLSLPFLPSLHLTAVAQETATAPACPKIWVGREAEIEEYIRTAKIDRYETVPIGVTKPKRAFFVAGGPVASIAWKPLRPGMRKGYWESYKAEIAAYELDKLLGMHMVPPAVERRDSDTGAAVLWVENIKGWKIDQPIRGPDPVAWDRQVITMKMFDNLIANTDRNAGNLLYDEEYHLILIDHSRAFTTTKKLVNGGKMRRIDKDYWNRIQALTPEQVTAALSKWLSKNEIKAIFERREAMEAEIEKLVSKTSAEAVFLK